MCCIIVVLLFQQKGLDFLSQCELVHNNLSLSTVFVDAATEWKIAGLEYSYKHGDTPPVKPVLKYDPPEGKGGQRGHKWCVWR